MGLTGQAAMLALAMTYSANVVEDHRKLSQYSVVQHRNLPVILDNNGDRLSTGCKTGLVNNLGIAQVRSTHASEEVSTNYPKYVLVQRFKEISIYNPGHMILLHIQENPKDHHGQILEFCYHEYPGNGHSSAKSEPNVVSHVRFMHVSVCLNLRGQTYAMERELQYDAFASSIPKAPMSHKLPFWKTYSRNLDPKKRTEAPNERPCSSFRKRDSTPTTEMLPMISSRDKSIWTNHQQDIRSYTPRHLCRLPSIFKDILTVICILSGFLPLVSARVDTIADETGYLPSSDKNNSIITLETVLLWLLFTISAGLVPILGSRIRFKNEIGISTITAFVFALLKGITGDQQFPTFWAALSSGTSFGCSFWLAWTTISRTNSMLVTFSRYVVPAYLFYCYFCNSAIADETRHIKISALFPELSILGSVCINALINEKMEEARDQLSMLWQQTLVHMGLRQLRPGEIDIV